MGWGGRRRFTALCGAVAALALLAAASASSTGAGLTASCATRKVGGGFHARANRALASGRDLWGDRLLSRAGGPTLAGVERFLPPLLYAVGQGGRPLTKSGVYYLPFTMPYGKGNRGYGLHVADGSQIIVRHVGGPSVTVFVGAGGRERYGSCLARLQTPQLLAGYLPVLQVAYRDALGVRYVEQSFVTRQRQSLVSFLRVSADASEARGDAVITFAGSSGRVIRLDVPKGQKVALDAALIHTGARLVRVYNEFAAARASVVDFWNQRLAGAATFEVPEPAIQRAIEAVEIEELEMSWRYSVGNTYEELSAAEALDVAQVMAEYGFPDMARQILVHSLSKLPAHFTAWRVGEQLVAAASYYRLHGDRAYLAAETPTLASAVRRLDHELRISRTGLLPREPYSSDISSLVYSLQGQSLVWQGALAMGRVWSRTGYESLGATSHELATRLGIGLRRAIRRSQRRLPDGSLFVPAALLERTAPFTRVTGSQAGSYWNLVVPYALASGLFQPGTPTTDGVLRYLLTHGSRLLGLVRSESHRLAGPHHPVAATDQVYGINLARFLADDDQADQLVLSLYGTLGAAMTRGTYVSGEAASVAPLGHGFFRSMYLPPNNDGAATFLETLRVMLVHERRARNGSPNGLDLAFATPRSWLANGKTIAVSNVPTSFGTVGYSLTRQSEDVSIEITPPSSLAGRALRLRLRLPAGLSLRSVVSDDVRVPFDPETDTIDFTGVARAGATGEPLVAEATVGPRA